MIQSFFLFPPLPTWRQHKITPNLILAFNTVLIFVKFHERRAKNLNRGGYSPSKLSSEQLGDGLRHSVKLNRWDLLISHVGRLTVGNIFSRHCRCPSLAAMWTGVSPCLSGSLSSVSPFSSSSTMSGWFINTARWRGVYGEQRSSDQLCNWLTI